MPKKTSPTIELAHWFVTEVVARPWTNEDYRSMHTKHAADLLKDYPLGDIQGCLEAMRDGLLGDLPFGIKSLTLIRSGEPPWISRWFEYKKNAPPIFLEWDYADWCRRTGVGEVIETQVLDTALEIKKVSVSHVSFPE